MYVWVACSLPSPSSLLKTFPPCSASQPCLSSEPVCIASHPCAITGVGAFSGGRCSPALNVGARPTASETKNQKSVHALSVPLEPSEDRAPGRGPKDRPPRGRLAQAPICALAGFGAHGALTGLNASNSGMLQNATVVNPHGQKTVSFKSCMSWLHVPSPSPDPLSRPSLPAPYTPPPNPALVGIRARCRPIVRHDWRSNFPGAAARCSAQRGS